MKLRFGKMRFAWLVAMLTCVTAVHLARAGTVVYSFTGEADGNTPIAGVIKDRTGNLYGTTLSGGGYGGCGGFGCGVVFKLAPDGTETVLHTFKGGKDGGNPNAGLIVDSAGHFYGTTYNGGGSKNCDIGCGTVFELAPDGAETILYSFAGKKDGAHPIAGLMTDEAGNLYGTTGYRGSVTCNEGAGCGTVFKLSPEGALSTIHTFAGGSDGAIPVAGLIQDRKGNLYGTTIFGGGGTDCAGGGDGGCGTVFEIAPSGEETILHAFAGTDGSGPEGPLLSDRSGNLYGITVDGYGIGCGGVGCGTVFKLGRRGEFTTLHVFLGLEKGDGGFGTGNLIMDKSGNLYGTTTEGGTGSLCAGGCGTVFKVEPDGTETVLHSFQGSDGYGPQGGLAADNKGHLFGTARGGSYNHGEVFGLSSPQIHP